MRNDLELNKGINIDKNESVESLSDREKAWESAFGDEYKPNFNYKEKFLEIKSDYYDEDTGFLGEFDDDKERFLELFNLLKNNGFRIDIQFLESLTNKQKNYLSLLFLDLFYKNLDKKHKMGKSLLLRFCRWELKGYKVNYFDNDKLYEISKNFEGFNLQYFRQATNYVTGVGDRDIYHIISEYNLIKNIDKDIKLPEISKLNSGEDYSLGVFHVKESELSGKGLEQIWGSKEFDKNGKETNFSIGEESADDGRFFYSILDRNHPSTYRDASGITYKEYLDSPTGIALFYKNKPIAVISFYIKNGNEFFINQIQKVPYYEYDRYGRCTGKHYSSITNDIDRQNTLYKVVKNLANKYNISRIIIQGGENNERTKIIYEDYETDYFNNKFFWIEGPIPPKNKREVHLDPKIAHRIYDVFAEGLGFNKNDDGNREMEI